MKSVSGRSQQPQRWYYLPRQYLFLIGAFVAGMILFALFRALFLASNTEFVTGEPFWQIITAFGVGVRFDQIVVLGILMPLTLLLPWLSLKWKAVRVVSLVYLTAFFSFSFLLLLTDIRFYHVFDAHLNFLAIDYLGEGAATGYLILTDPMFYIYMAIWLGSSAVFLFILRKVMNGVTRIGRQSSWTGRVVFFLLFVTLTVGGMRGRVSLAPIDWGMAYFSQNRFLNQLALNGIYTLGRTLSEKGRDPRLSYMTESQRFPFVELDDALKSVQAMVVGPHDEWLDQDSSLLRITRQEPARFGFQPNIVIVMMESWAARNTGCLGSPDSLSPSFDRLADDGILFANFFAGGTRTSYGLSAALGSFPAVPGRSIMKRYNALHPFVTLPELLHERGYYNAFAYGGDIAFDNMEGFFRQKGYDLLYGDKDFGLEKAFSKWGIPDHVMAGCVTDLIDSLPRPFQTTWLTLSNHEPFDLPDSSLQRYRDNSEQSRIFNCQLYADNALGLFMDAMRKRPVFDSMIFLFVSDHTRYGNSRLFLDPGQFHIPLLIYAPALLGDTAQRIERYGGQVDILPTLMGLLGDDYRHASWGRDLLNADDDGYAVMNVLNRIGIANRDLVYIEDVGRATGYLHREGEDYVMVENVADSSAAVELKQQLHRLVQLVEQLSTPRVAQ